MIHFAKDPKYMIIAKKIREEILSGQFPEGSKLPPDEVMAKAYGINKRTVAAGMASLVADGLITRTPGRGTIVVRQKVVERRTDMICCITWSSGDLFDTLQAETTEEMLKRGFYPAYIPYSLFRIGADSMENQQLRRYMELAINNLPHGMLIYGERFVPYDLIERNLKKCGNLVFIWDYSNDHEIPAKYVLIDYEAAAKKAANYFQKNGHKKVTLLTTPVNNIEKYARKPPQYRYHKALEKACANIGIEYDNEIPMMLWNKNPEEGVFETILRRKITAAAMTSDSAYFFHYKSTMEKLNIRIPEDLSLIGFYNIKDKAKDLTTFDVKTHKMATLSANMLFENSDEIKRIYVEPELIERKSVSNKNMQQKTE